MCRTQNESGQDNVCYVRHRWDVQIRSVKIVSRLNRIVVVVA